MKLLSHIVLGQEVGHIGTGKIVELRFPEEDHLRSRKVVTRSRGRSTGKYPSWKMNRMIQWESPHELNACRLLDCDPNVAYFQEQPLEIRYEQNGHVHRHYPDLLVKKASSKELWEVKTRSDARKPEIANRTALMTTELPRFGFRYCMVLAEDLRAQPILTNALLILQHGRARLSLQEEEVVLQYLNKYGQFRWADIQAGLFGIRGLNCVCRLLLDGVITVDTSKLIGAETSITKCLDQVVGRSPDNQTEA